MWKRGRWTEKATGRRKQTKEQNKMKVRGYKKKENIYIERENNHCKGRRSRRVRKCGREKDVTRKELGVKRNVENEKGEKDEG